MISKNKIADSKIDNWTIFWAWVGKIGIIIPIVLGLIELGKMFLVKEYDVKAVGHFKFYEIPDSLFSEIDIFRIKIDSLEKKKTDTLQQNIKLKNATESFLTRLLEKMNNYDYNIPGSVGSNISDIYTLLYPPEDTTRVDKFDFVINSANIQDKVDKLRANIYYPTYIFRLRLENNGNRELNNVNLKINFVKGYFRIREIEEVKGSEGFSEEISDFLEDINIGKIEAKETKDIIVWIEKPVKKEQFRLTQSGNIIDIDFEEFEVF